MKFGVYAIRDVHTGFLTPTFEVNDNVAMRNFNHAVNNSDSVLFTSMKDFDLYRIGEYDSDTGRITPLDLPVVLMSATDCLK
uniref:Nonstructural protein n=1 Tax=Dulem virus 113 TaxID=3145590 RepID=A0AAU8B8G2_9VIRU